MNTFRNYIFGFVLLAFAAFVIPSAASAQTHKSTHNPKVQTAKVVISGYEYRPGSLKLKRGVPARITFQRISDDTCGTEIVIADYGIHRPLPLNENVSVSFTPKNAGELTFSCGMNMMKGKIIVQ